MRPVFPNLGDMLGLQVGIEGNINDLVCIDTKKISRVAIDFLRTIIISSIRIKLYATIAPSSEFEFYFLLSLYMKGKSKHKDWKGKIQKKGC